MCFITERAFCFTNHSAIVLGPERRRGEGQDALCPHYNTKLSVLGKPALGGARASSFLISIPRLGDMVYLARLMRSARR